MLGNQWSQEWALEVVGRINVTKEAQVAKWTNIVEKEVEVPNEQIESRKRQSAK